MDRFRREIVSASLLLVSGTIQRSPEGVVHLMAETLEDRSAALRGLDQADIPGAMTRSRDFH